MKSTEPRIYYAPELGKRSYISFYLLGHRIREYNGKALGIEINPNSAKTLAERNYLLETLHRKLSEAVHSGRYNREISAPVKSQKELPSFESTEVVLRKAFHSKANLNLSSSYVETLRKMLEDFIEFLSEEEATAHISSLSSKTVYRFLLQYNKTASYYMNRRRHLKALLSEASRIVDMSLSCLKNLPIQKPKPAAHLPYSEEQVQQVLKYLKLYDKLLYVCASISYYCWLRPHNEVRFLKAHHFLEDCSKIVLGAHENKSGKVRSVFVPQPVKTIVLPLIQDLGPDDNLFSRCTQPFNLSYFSKKWQRCAKELRKRGVIQKGHTLYSFRHTAAVELYRKTSDVALLQRIMGHEEITTTMTYLRGIGELSLEDWKQATPTIYNI